MPGESDKHAAQTAFMDAENIQEFYRQIVSQGHILAGGESLTQQIAQERFPEIAPVVHPEIQHEKGIEPER